MYQRAERRHLAEVAAARLLETTMPVTSTLSGVRTHEEPRPVATELAVVGDAPIESEAVVEPVTPAARINTGAASASESRKQTRWPVSSARTQPDLRLVAPSPLVKPVVPAQAARPVTRMTRDQQPLLPVAALGTMAAGALVAIVLTIWPRGYAEGPAITESTVARSETAGDAAPTGPTPLSVASNTSGQPSSTAAARTSAAATSGEIVAATGGKPQPVPPTPSTAETSGDTPAPIPVSTAGVGQLRITSSPDGAHVTINGIGWGQTPVTVKNLPLGTKTVRLTSDGYTSQQRTVQLGSGGAYAVHVALKRQVKQ
jgi:hypothetical protein